MPDAGVVDLWSKITATGALGVLAMALWTLMSRKWVPIWAHDEHLASVRLELEHARAEALAWKSECQQWQALVQKRVRPATGV